VEYAEDHLRTLSVIAAKLAAYFTIRGTSADLAELIGERDRAWRVVEDARRVKDELLALVSCELGMRPPSADGSAGAELERQIQAQAQRLDELLGQARLASAELRVALGAAAAASPGRGDPPSQGGWKRRGPMH